MDHVGGNEIVGAAGVEINPDAFSDEPHATVLSHENVLTRLSGDDNDSRPTCGRAKRSPRASGRCISTTTP